MSRVDADYSANQIALMRDDAARRNAEFQAAQDSIMGMPLQNVASGLGGLEGVGQLAQGLASGDPLAALNGLAKVAATGAMLTGTMAPASCCMLAMV